MFDREFKIKLIQYLESVTPWSTESHSLEKMTTRYLDDLIRLCRVNPDDPVSMERAKENMEQHALFREELRKKFWGKELAEEMNEMYSALGPDCKLAFTQFIDYNLDHISLFVTDDADFAWLKDYSLMPSIDFWSGGLGVVMKEILYRLGHDQTVDGALTSKFTHYGKVRPAICCDTLVRVLDTESKNDLFWRYARARLGR